MARHPMLGTGTMSASQQRSDGVIPRIRALLSYALVALACGWATFSYHTMATPASSAAPVRSSAEASTSRPPWDPEGCQTLAFFHVPKTGGESMNELWRDMDGHKRLPLWADGYSIASLRVTGLDLEKQKKRLMSMKPWSQEERTRRHKVVELHCGDALSFMQARNVLEAMRAEHEENDCGFFAFTVIRPPLDWLVSLYDDICHRRLRGHKDTCPQQADMTPKEEMLAYPHRDGLVSYLTHGWNGWDSPGPVDDATVEELVSSLKSHLDHVAFTNEVPVLRKYLTKRFAAPDNVLTPEAETALDRGAKQNANTVKKVRVSDFSPEELRRLNSTIQLDWKLFEAVASEHRPLSLELL